jgi:hypothetical protein
VKWQLLFALLLLGWSVPAGSADTAEPVTVSAICGKLVSIEGAAEKGTTSSGREDAKPIPPGDYWLVANISGVDYKLLIRYQPGKKGEAKCAEFLYALEKGQLHLRSSTAASVATPF